jgi:hypothetical protein
MVYETQPQNQPAENQQPVPKKSNKLVLTLFMLALLLIVAGVAAYLMSEEEVLAPNETSQTVEKVEETTSGETKAPVLDEEELKVEENEYFSLVIPEGFIAVDERIFTFTGPPKTTYSFSNSDTGDYFEVNIEPAQSGINADFTWIYVYEDGVFTVDKSDSTVCTPEESEWCEFSGNNDRLDSSIFSEMSQEINGEEYYFTFGNIISEEVGDLTYVDQFLESLEIK